MIELTTRLNNLVHLTGLLYNTHHISCEGRTRFLALRHFVSFKPVDFAITSSKGYSRVTELWGAE